jgi:hypothetical protein
MPLPTQPPPIGRTRFEACDPRADNSSRVIDVAREEVTIRRAVAGVPMAIRVASGAYHGVGLRVACVKEGRFRYEVRLVHRDPDLSVSLAEGDDERAIEDRWRAWVGFLRLPALVERIEGMEIEVNLGSCDLTQRSPIRRRRGSATSSRRPRFLRRRKAGRLVPCVPLYSDPEALSPGSKSGR